ncbi:MAG: penicillin-binding protein 2 [Pseudomonadota bacterium]
MKIQPNPFSQEKEQLAQPHLYLTVAVCCLFLFLFFRLWYLQIVKGPEYRTMSESNRTRVQDILAPRGLILDRNGMILVDNHPSYEMALVREDVPDMNLLADRLSKILNRPREEVKTALEGAKSTPSFKPAVIFTGMSRDELVALETHRFELPGIVIQVNPRRKYLQDKLASHIVGYLGEITQGQLNREEYRDHRMGDLVGQFGIEMSWESWLHGKRGRNLAEVDVSGRILKIINKVDPIPGHNLFLTIDARLQRAAQEALGDNAGAVAALDPNTGEILAMASAPTFSQNTFVEGITPEQWKDLVQNPLHPLENRAISGQYPPGSTFKIISAAAGLEEGVVYPETYLSCTGAYAFGNWVYHCWKKTGHGRVNLHRSLVESCDTYYYEVGRRLGVDNLAKYSRMFGLGSKTGIGLANEKPGLVPDSEWKKKRFKTPWQKGETLSVIIGQGYNLATPLQMAQVTAVIANGGTLFQSRLVKMITNGEGAVIKAFGPTTVRRLNLKPGTIDAIRKGLAGVVSEPSGTGRQARIDGIEVAGKTGTSQVVALKKFEGFQEKDLPYKYKDHAWFVAYAPVENPKIAVAVVIEHAGHGGSVAAPVARQVIQAYLRPDEPWDDKTLPEETVEAGD